MGALPNVKPKLNPKRPAFKVYEYDRDKLRKQTDYTVSPAVGWSPLYNAMLVDLPRLSRSISFMSLITWVLRHAQGLDSSRPTSTEPLPDEFLAACSAPDASVPASAKLREFQRNCDYGTRAGIFTRKKVGQGYSVFSLRLAAWASLPDYKTWLASNLHEVDETENQEPPVDDPAQQDAGDWRLKAPVKVQPGKVAKPHKIDFGVKEFQVDASKAGSEVLYDLSCKGGKFVISLEFTGNLVPKTGETEANEKRHARRDFTTPSPTFRQVSGEQKANKHPRADEIAAIFDPLLKKSATPGTVRLLSVDEVALRAACEAVGNMPHDILVHALLAGDDPRAGRPISSPKHCALIISELRRNWEKAGGVPDIQLPRRKSSDLPSADEIEAIAQREREALQKAREAARRRK